MPLVTRNMPILDELAVSATIGKKTLYLAAPRYVEPGWAVLTAGTQKSMLIEGGKSAEQP